MALITTGNAPKALSGDGRMAKLTAKARKAIPSGDFALPGRRYPVPDAAHGRAALSRVSQFGSPTEKAKVRAKVRRKFPGIGQHAHHPSADG